MLKNKIIVASAGSGKTTGIIEKVAENLGKSILITTYTNNNVYEIYSKFHKHEKFGFIPEKVDIISLNTFFLRHGVKPFQDKILNTDLGRVKSIDYDSEESYFKNKKNRKYYLNKNNDIFNNKVTEFICDCNIKSDGLIIDRLEKIYDIIIIDEIQDINGKYDFEFIELLLSSNIEILLVGDHRQSLLNTNTTAKAVRKEKGIKIIEKFKKWEEEGLCVIKYKNISYRCCKKICAFADLLFPEIQKTISKRADKNEHEGVFIIKNDEEAIKKYYFKYKKRGDNIKVLRTTKKEQAYSLDPLNIGLAKGKEYDRVIIFFTKDLKKYLTEQNFNFVDGTKCNFYVAITRAKYSVLLVSDADHCRFKEIQRLKTGLDEVTLFSFIKTD